MPEKEKSEQAEAVAEAVEEVNVFKQLLSVKDEVHTIRVRTPFSPKPLVVHFMRLGPGEEPKTKLPENFADKDDDERAETFREFNSKFAWLMINKANKSGLVPKEYLLERRDWDAIRKTYPDVFDAIVGRVTGAFAEIMDFLLSGQTSPS